MNKICKDVYFKFLLSRLKVNKSYSSKKSNGNNVVSNMLNGILHQIQIEEDRKIFEIIDFIYDKDFIEFWERYRINKNQEKPIPI